MLILKVWGPKYIKDWDNDEFQYFNFALKSRDYNDPNFYILKKFTGILGKELKRHLKYF